jgi:MFS family permease
MLAAAAATAALAAATWAVVRDDPGARGYRSQAVPAAPAAPGAPGAGRPATRGFEVFRYPNTWLLFVIPSGLVGSVLSFSGLWGVPFLTTHYRLTTAEASTLTSALLVAWALASPVFGRLSDRIGRRKPLLIAGHGAALAGWTVILFVPGIPLPMLTVVMAATGFFSAGFIISFALAKESVPARHAGMISGVVNMGIMMGPTVLQPAIGWMLDRRWQGEMIEGARVYSLDAYRFGFSLIPAWILLSLVLVFLTRETHCRQTG